MKKFPSIVRTKFEKLGTEIDLQIVVENEDELTEAEKDLTEVQKIYSKFDIIFSRFESESELSKLNLALGKFNQASDHICEIVLRSLAYHRETGGLYDPRILGVLEDLGYADDFKRGMRRLNENSVAKEVFFSCELENDLKGENGFVFFGTRMDFSGIAKGYITDRVAEFLIQKEWRNFLVDSGGDMFMLGMDEQGMNWTVSVEGIDQRKLILALDNKGVATSGIGRRRWEIEGRRMHHIINPKNPKRFNFDLKSVSVIADSTSDADVWAKTLFLMGKEDGIVYARKHDLAAIILDYRGSAWISPEAKKFVQ